MGTEQKHGRNLTRLLGWLVVAVVIVAAAVTVAVTLTVDHRPKRAALTGYGQKAVDVAHTLGTCRKVTVYSNDVARCVTKQGKFVAVETQDNPTDQAYSVSLLKDRNPTACSVVVKGVVFTASTRTVLTQAIGDLDGFARHQSGEVVC